MTRKRFAAAVLSLLAAALITGCGKAPEKAPEKVPAAKTTVTYMGQASLRIATPENKVIYIDPFSGEEAWYEPAADLILVTHGHRDHNQTDLIKNRSSDCRIITHEEALKDGVHQTFDLDYVTVEAVEACNENHPIDECVGYILTFPDGRTLYVSGDTSATEQMASSCAKLVAAKHSIPYHMAPGAPNNFDREIAEQFEAEGRIILEPGETLTLE